MSLAKKIANAKYEEEASLTTRCFGRRGIGRTNRRIKRVRNRAAKRAEARLDFESQ